MEQMDKKTTKILSIYTSILILTMIIGTALTAQRIKNINRRVYSQIELSVGAVEAEENTEKVLRDEIFYDYLNENGVYKVEASSSMPPELERRGRLIVISYKNLELLKDSLVMEHNKKNK